MGIDIVVYAEKKQNNKWQFTMPESNFDTKSLYNYCNSFDVGGRVPVLFQVLSRIYEDKYGRDFKSISNNKGLPEDISSETKFYLEDLSHCSYVSLREILDFDWDLDSEEYDKYKDIVPEEFFDNIVIYLKSLVSELDKITEKDIRIVFGYSM